MASVKVIVDVPAAIPVTTPVVALTVAILVFDDTHAAVLAGVAVLFKSKLLLPTQTVNKLVDDVITGSGLTVNVSVF